jgi:hypothetical protein
MTPVIRTASGHWGWDEHRYFGHAVFGELATGENLTGLLALSILGRRVSAADCAVLDCTASCVTLADPRIWPLKMTRLVAAYGHSVAATAAGLLIEEEARIGPWTTLKSGEVLTRFRTLLGPEPAQEDLRREVDVYLADHRFIWGFGTPFREHDERLVAYRRCLEPLGMLDRPYFRLAAALADAVHAACGKPMNMGMAVAAVLLDLGLELHQVGPMTTALMQHMFFAHAVEAARESPAVARRLPEECIDYVGPSPRSSPRAGGSQ